jgi:hypothetical protein
MVFNAPASPLPLYFVLSDSHSKFLPSLTITSTHRIIIKSISGLRWLFTKNRDLCATYQLQRFNISSYLASSTAIMLLIGTNSIRSSPASKIIQQIEDLIHLLRHLHPHLRHKDNIHIVATFPCLKTSRSFPSSSSLRRNIRLYNNQLLELSTTLNFSVVDFNLEENHLRRDKIHIHYKHQYILEDGLFNYFHQLLPVAPPVPLPTPLNRRSQEALRRRNTSRTQRRTNVYKQFCLKRSITSPWNLQSAKSFLHQQQIKFSKVPPIYHNIIRIQFNNSASLEAANNKLSNDVFSTETFSRYFS